MRIVLQRIKHAEVRVGGSAISSVGKGILIFLAVHRNDTAEEVRWLVDKCVNLRIFEDEDEKREKSVLDIGGEVMVVSQFTLYGDCRKGRRPSFSDSASAEKGRELYELFVDEMRKMIPTVASGQFQALMDVDFVNDGPCTLILDRDHIPK